MRHFQRNHLQIRLILLGEILSSVWERNRELANQYYQIKTLRGLIPICDNCKQVRNDQGCWEQIEAYVGRYSETTLFISKGRLQKPASDIADHPFR